jgi:hypothetical protein
MSPPGVDAAVLAKVAGVIGWVDGLADYVLVAADDDCRQRTT